MEDVQMIFPDPPRGIKAIPFRAPIWMFRTGLGWIMGSRFLLLTHIGRKTGLPRQTVLEIINESPDRQVYTVVSGFGSKSQWYKNIIHNPKVKIQVGTKKFQALARRLDPDQAEKVFQDYIQRFPRGFQTLAYLIGYQIEHTEEGYRKFSRQIPIIQFKCAQQSPI